MIFGSAVGFERRQKRQAAGMRTHALVCLGATIVMLSNQYIVEIYGGDPARMGSQVISGIGFLGVGTIIVDRRQQVRGLTTAASLWVCACMGLALGSGFMLGAAIGFVCILFINKTLNRLENFLISNSRTIELYVILDDHTAYKAYKDMLLDEGLNVLRYEMAVPYDLRGKRDTRVAANIRIKLYKREPHAAVLEKINNFDGLLTLEEIG